MGESHTYFKKIMLALITSISNKALLESTKSIYHWTPQSIRSTKIFGISRVNKTKVTGAYSQCGRNKVYYCDFFDKADFVSEHTV